ncbi:haloacid dehalogenase-like hydrolase [Desulfobulbus alkaliphilus]|uniref:haloacid dehalogenase-like hydrolase n=1 Tax=Desulfobulbus alkaliphilus TaxID=869814 RepID=UPI001964EDC4|nr:haloacid dehalogenase-like hydrolase [Desulfobulbus alkaliphilus]
MTAYTKERDAVYGYKIRSVTITRRLRSLDPEESLREPLNMKPRQNEMHRQPADSISEPRNWHPGNLSTIRGTIQEHILGSGRQEAVAVFDFDNTCIFRDVGQAVFRYQMLHLRYRIPPGAFAALLPDREIHLTGRPLAVITTALIDAYEYLWAFIGSGEQDKARLTTEYRLFTTLLLWFADQARRDERLGPSYVLPFMGKMLAGHSLTDLRALAREVLTATTAEPLTKQTLTMDLPAPLGHIAASYSQGLHAHREMDDLMRMLAQAGIDSYVISASTEWLVAEAIQQLGFPVPEERIFGIRVRIDDQGLLTADNVADYPVTFREGKAEIIRRFIARPLILVAGDADTDYEMLTLPDVPVRILINRNQPGLISSLYQDPRILLQGLDLRSGRFRPHRESIPA